MKANFLKFWVITLLCLAGCSPLESSSEIPWPTNNWQISSPEAQNVDSAVLDQMLTHIDETHLNLHSLLIIRNGRIILEKYYPPYTRDTKHELYSVTKSFTSTLAGIALDQGKLTGLNQPVLDLFPDMIFANNSFEKESINIENLLTMTSGLDWLEGDSSYTAMYRSSNWVKWVMDLPMADPPGKEFRYCSGCSHVLSTIVNRAAATEGASFASRYLFSPLGIRDFEWETDQAGIPIGGWGLKLTTRDMAKLGYLYLNSGQWEGSQIVSKTWVQTAVTKHVDTEGDLGYGYQWWTYPRHNGYAALGRYGQTIFVLPDAKIIVVITAEIDGHDAIFKLIDDYIVPSATD